MEGKRQSDGDTLAPANSKSDDTRSPEDSIDGAGTTKHRFDVINDTLREITAQLRFGGPPVNFELVVHFIDGQLNDEAKQQVGQNIVTWRSWYDMYWETIAALDHGGSDDLGIENGRI